MTHIIQQQHLEVELNGTESEGLALQHRLSGVCNDWLLPALERVLDRCAPAGGHLYIERLEVDAGAVSLDRFEQELVEAVTQSLERSLREQVMPGASEPPSGAGGGDLEIQRKSEAHAAAEVLLYFLEHGRLPWFFRLPANVPLEQHLLKALQMADTQRHINAAIVHLLRTSAAARQRLAWQFPTHFRESLLGMLAPQLLQTVRGVLSKVSHPLLDAAAFGFFEQALWQTAFAHAGAEPVSVDAPTLVAKALPLIGETAAPQRHEALLGNIKAIWPELLASPTGTSTQTSATKHGPAAISPARTDEKHGPKTTRADGGQTPLSETQKKAATGPKTDAPAPRGHFPQSAVEVAAEGIYIDNAGLVLLHPFLSLFFEALQVSKGTELLQPERALCLLHFLATGQETTPEYELVLPKILCNIPLETPVETNLSLTDLEKEEAEALLKAAIRHWDALRDTSPDGLRGTFLCRPGKLNLRDDGDWQLQVERKSYDILLDQLPWGIGMIKLPWMETMLWTNWE